MGMPDPDVMEAKATVRAQLLAARVSRGDAPAGGAAEAIARHGRQLCEGARTVAAYVATPTEPPTEPLLAALREAGVRVLLPVVDGERLDWAADTGERRPGEFGIPVPAGPRLGPAALALAEVVLVPTLAVDRHGVRLGRGRGFYDRALPLRSSTALTVAIVYDDEVLDDDLPAEPHDVNVDAVLTPAGVRRLRPT